MANYNGHLNSNEIFAAIYNMIISQQVFADNIKGTNSKLVDKARVDGGLYGDTKLYYATDALKSAAWGNDAEAENLLELHRPQAPKCQAITLDVFRQIRLTVDNYLSKRAFATEGAFANFNSVMKGWITDTKKIYDATTYNAYVGTAETATGNQTITLTLPTDTDAEKQARLQGQYIAKEVADLLVDLTDVSRDYNDYGFIRSYNPEDLMFVWNADAVNEITKMDLPTIFHKDALISKLGEYTLPAKYFGTVNSGTKPGDDTTVRSLVEQEIGSHHYFAGDIIATGDTAPAGTSYTQNDNILFKIIHKDSIPYMSAFEVGTSFFNPRSLTETNYLTFGHNTLQYLKDKPLITVKKNA